MFKKMSIMVTVIVAMCCTLCVTASAANETEVVESKKSIEVQWDVEQSCIVVENVPVNDGNVYKVLLQNGNQTNNWYAEEQTNLPINADGQYVVKVYRQISGNKYRCIHSVTMNIEGSKPYLGSSEYIDFEEAQSLLALESVQAIINSESMNDSQKVKAAYKFVKNAMTYDYELAASVKSGYTPNADENLVDKKGICFDYASMLAVILRNADIQTKMVFGDTSYGYHAWNEVLVDGQWIMVDACWGEYATTNYYRSVTQTW